LSALPQPPFHEPPRQRPSAVPRRDGQKSGWLKIAGWVLGAFGLLVVLLAITAGVLIHSPKFHAFMLRTAQQKATAGLGVPVQLRDFALHVSFVNPVLDLYGVTVHGRGPNQDPPLLQADELHMEVTIASLLRRSWYVNEIRIQRPVVHVFVDAQGQTNLPAGKSSSQPSNPNTLFDLGIRHFVLERGEVYYNDAKSELTADMREVVFRSGFDPGNKRYSGELSYRDGHLRWSKNSSVPHSLNATFSATPQEFRIENAVLSTSSSRASLSGSMTDYLNPRVEASYKAVLDLNEFRRTLSNPSLPEGVVELSGAFNYANPQNQPLLTVIVMKGDVFSRALATRYNDSRIAVRDLSAHYSVGKGNATVSDLRARVLGGSLSGKLDTSDLTGSASSRLSATLRGVSVPELQHTFARSTTSRTSAQGSLDLTINATWVKAMQQLMAQADAKLQATIQSAQGSAPVPVNGLLHSTYNSVREQISFTNSYVRAPQTSVSLNGTVSNQSALQIQMQSNQLRDLENLAQAFRDPGAAPLGLSGQASLQATVTGSTHRPQVTGQLTSNGLRVRGSSFKLLRANISTNPTEFRIENGELDPATQGRIAFEATTGLANWELEKSSRFRLKLSASQVNAAEVARAAGTDIPVIGTLAADVDASGTQLQPTGHGTVQLTRARIGAEPVRSVSLQFQGNGTRLDGKLQLELPTAGSATATVQYQPSDKAYVAEVRSTGIKLDKLQTLLERNLEVSGTLNLSASGRGTLDDPQLQAQLEIPELRVRTQTIHGLKLQSTVANHAAQFTLDSKVFDSYARGRGTVKLAGDYPADVSFDTQAIQFAPLVSLYAPSQAANLSGQTELHATLHGPLKNKAQLEAHVVIPQLSLNYKNVIQLAAAAPIRADYANGVLDLQRSVIRGTDTEITMQARLPSAKDAPVSLLLKGGVDLRLAQLISPDITSGGKLQFDIDSYGSRADPSVQGQIRIVDASFATVDLPVGLQGGNGVLTLTGDRLSVSQFHGKVGGGDVSASGAVVYRPDLRFDLGLSGKGVRILYAQSLRTTVDSNLALSGNFNNALLRGQIGIEQLAFTPDFDLMDFAAQFGGEETPPPPQGFSQNVHLDVSVETPGGLDLASRTLSVAGNANLQVRGTAAQPVMLGRVNLSNGDLIFSGNRYVLQGGTIDFRNPSRTEPVVDMAVSTTISQYDIQMRFWGPADHLHTNYASDPSLPPSDIINLIAFGKTSEAAAANPTPPGSLGAQSLIASQVSNQVTSRIEKLAGISQLSIDPVLGNGQQSSGARLAVQQRVTSKIFVTFSTDVTATQQQIVKFEYQLNRRTSFDAVRDQNGGFSFQTSFRKQW
jgi:translocation and assembly module TamB